MNVPSSRNRNINVLQAQTIVCLLIPALLLGVSTRFCIAVRGGSRLADCLQNLHRIGQLSVQVANADNRMIPHRQAAAGQLAWRGLGAFDWGGADGLCGAYSSNWPDSPSFAMGAGTRPYNLAAFGSPVPPDADFSLFACPSDTGSIANAGYDPQACFPDPCTPDDPEPFHHSISIASGTSYEGDFIWYAGETINNQSTARRYGAFMRPFEMMPNPAELILFAETRFMQAYCSTSEFVDGGAFPGQPAQFIPPWHGPDGHNLLLADGHTLTVAIAVSGSMLPTTAFDPILYPERMVMARGAGWRTDAFPEGFVIEQNYGNALTSTPQQTPLQPGRPSIGAKQQ